MKKLLKKYVIRKYIFTESAEKAIKADKKTAVDDVWIDEDWKKEILIRQEGEMGYNTQK